MPLLDDFVWRAVLAGLLIAVVSGPLGCFVVWRRMAYFGDTLAHSALMGVALGLVLGLSPNLGTLVACIVLALMLGLLEGQRRLPSDTLLGILAHSSLAIGIVAISTMGTVRVDLMGYLFGDILAVTQTDVLWMIGGALGILFAMAIIWRPLLAITIHRDLAAAEGVPVFWTRQVFMLLIAVIIAGAMKVVGILLITSLMIIPAAAARRFARNPEAMAVAASLIGMAAVGAGIWSSFRWDTPTGPTIVAAAAGLFALSLLAGPAGKVASAVS